MNNMLYIVYGVGADAVGLVDAITTPIARVSGNIIDMRQDVLHGLFTIHMVVDLTAATVSVKEFRALIERIAADTKLRLAVDKYAPAPESGEKKHMLVTLVGRDKPGIIAAMTEKLGRYNINIEATDVVAREDLFLMDLLCNVGRSALPTENLKAAVRDTMSAVGISTMFQTENVFNKKKKLILFDVAGSFMDRRTMEEIVRQARIPAADLCRADEAETDLAFMHKTAQLLHGIPLSVVETVNRSVTFSEGTRELLQTLTIMGCKIGMISRGVTFFTSALGAGGGIDYTFGFELPVDDDSQTIVGDLLPGMLHPIDRTKIIAGIRTAERIAEEDVTVIADDNGKDGTTPGIRLLFDMKVILDLLNRHALSRDSLTGLLRSFGIPRL